MRTAAGRWSRPGIRSPDCGSGPWRISPGVASWELPGATPGTAGALREVAPSAAGVSCVRSPAADLPLFPNRRDGGNWIHCSSPTRVPFLSGPLCPRRPVRTLPAKSHAELLRPAGYRAELRKTGHSLPAKCKPGRALWIDSSPRLLTDRRLSAGLYRVTPLCRGAYVQRPGLCL